MFVCYNKIGLI